MLRTTPRRSSQRVHIAVCIVLFLGLILTLGTSTTPPTQAAGSRFVNIGWRSYIEWHETARSGGILRRTTVKAYVKAGEQVYVGSSAMNVGPAGNVVFRGPGNVGGDCKTLAATAPAQPADYGRIDTLGEEQAGPLPDNVNGYRPCVIAATATTLAGDGIWEFDFISPLPTALIGGNPPALPANAAWVQDPAHHWINAWDISVRNATDNDVPGRVFANYLAYNMGGNANATNTIGLSATYWIVTNDGYGYTIDMNGIDPFGFIFFSNAEGVIDVRGTPTYRSLQLVGNAPNVDLPSGYSLHNPANPDNTSTHDITHKIFFEVPDPTLPELARTASASGTTWLLPLPVAPPTATNFSFSGIEGTLGQAGTAPLSGNFGFDAPPNINYLIVVDVSRDGVFGNANDRSLTGVTFPGRTSVPWDGVDGLGTPVPAGAQSYSAQIQLNVGEVHFPFIDAETNPNGLKLVRFRGGSTVPTDLIYYNDDFTYTGASAYNYSPCAAVGDAPAPPAGTINPPFCYGAPSAQRSALQGVASLNGAHTWTPAGAPAVGFGDRRLIDTWAYFPSSPQPLSGSLVLAEAELSITKTHAPAQLVPGQEVTYSVAVTNDGPSAAVGARVRDDVPAAIISPTWTCTVAGVGRCVDASGSGNMIDTTVDLDPNSVATYTIRGVLNTSASGSLTNTASVRRPNDNTDPDPTNNTARNIAPILAVADLELNKTISTVPPIAANSLVEFEIALRNRGPSDATGVAVTDRLPTGLAFDSATPSKGSYDAASGLWTVGTMARDEVATLAIRARWDGSLVQNTAEVTGSDQTDPDSTPGNNNPSEDDQSSASLPLQIADLELTKRVDLQRVNVGSNVIFTIDLLNRGTDAASGVRVSERLPIGLSFVAATPSQGSYNEVSGSWDVGSLAAGAQATLLLEATVLDPGPFTNVAQISESDQYDPDSDPNNDDSDEDDQGFATVGGDLADLSLSKSVDNPQPQLDSSIVYTVRLDNAGPSTATGVAVTDELPAGLTFVSATASQGSYDAATGRWTVGTVPSGGSATLRITAQVVSGAAIVNTAQVSAADQPDPDSRPGNNDQNEDDQASAQLTPQISDLELTKVVDNAQPPVGGEVTFTIAVTNRGPSAASSVEVTEQLPTGLIYVSHIASRGSYDPASGIWAIGGMNIDDVVTLQLRVRVSGVGPFTNTAQISNSDQYDPDSTPGNTTSGEDDQGSATVGGAMADLSVSKRANAPRPATDGTITYTVGVYNSGPSIATGVHVSDQLPAGATLLNATPNQGTYAAGDWNVGTLAVNTGATITMLVQLGASGPYTNVAQVSASDLPDPDSTPNNNLPGEDDQASVALPSGIADLELTKEAFSLAPRLPNGVVYLVRVVNRGPDNATNVEVSDPLPAGLVFVSAAPSQGSYNAASGIWQIGGIPTGGVVSLQITALIVGAGDIVNTAQVSRSDQFDPDSTPNNNLPGEDDQASVTINRLTAITLLSFSAERQAAGVLVRWQTGSELNTIGFQLRRSASGERAGAEIVTPQLILARGSGGGGARYSFIDTSAAPGVTYSYWLVEVASDGSTSEHGPIRSSPTLSTVYRVFLPILKR